MTQDRALKRAIRRRMEESDEKYTEARRALLGGDAGEPPFSFKPFWEEERRKYEEVADREGEAVGRAGVYEATAALHLMFALPHTPAVGVGRGPSAPGGWLLPKRSNVEGHVRAIEVSAPLVGAGFGHQIERNRQIVERVLALIDEGAGAPTPAQGKSEEGRAPRYTVKWRPTLPAGGSDGWGRSRELDHEPLRSSRDRALRHPRGVDLLRGTAEGMGDPELAELIEAWIDDLESNYQQLIDGMPTGWRRHGQLDFEAVIEDLADEDDPDPNFDWSTVLPSPARVRVDNPIKGNVGDREAVVTNILVAEGEFAHQSDGIVAVARERWHIRGHRLIDGTIMPCRGTYRVASAAAPTAR